MVDSCACFVTTCDRVVLDEVEKAEVILVDD